MTEVTDIDRQAAGRSMVLAEMRDLVVAGRADHHAEPWAAHRQAGYDAGLKRGVQLFSVAVSDALKRLPDETLSAIADCFAQKIRELDHEH